MCGHNMIPKCWPKQASNKEENKKIRGYIERMPIVQLSKDAKKKEKANKQTKCRANGICNAERKKKTLSKRASRLDTETARDRVCVVVCVLGGWIE